MKIFEDKEKLLQAVSVLYVEDDTQTREAMSHFLKKKIKKLHISQNGEYGLELFKVHKQDIIITDINMPHLDGLEMMQAVKKIKKDVKVIFISAFSQEEYFLKAIEVGADGFLPKPVSTHGALLPMLCKVAAEVMKENMLAQYNNTLKLILDATDAMVIVTDGENIFNCNMSFLNFLQIESIKKLNQKHFKLSSLLVKEKDMIAGENWLQQALKSKAPKIKIKNNRFLVKTNRIDNSINANKYVVTMVQIDTLEKQNCMMCSKNNELDPFTKLLYKESFASKYEAQLTKLQQTKTPFSLIFLTFKNLEEINIKYSFEKGDEILQEISQIIAQSICKEGYATRWHGGKFILLLPQKDQKIATALQNELEKKIKSLQISYKIHLQTLQRAVKLSHLIEQLK